MKISNPNRAQAGQPHDVKRLVIISNLGADTKVGPCNDRKLASGGTYRANEAQKWLHQQFLESAKRYHKPDYLLVNGLGVPRKLDKTEETGLADPVDQADLVASLINRFDAGEIRMTREPSNKIEVNGKPFEKYVAELVGAKACEWSLHLNLNGTECSFAPRIQKNISPWVYRFTPAALQMVLNKLSYGDRAAELLIRSAKYFCGTGIPPQLAIITPGWTSQTPLDQQQMPEVTPRVGTVCVTLPDLDVDYMTWHGPMLPGSVPSRGRGRPSTQRMDLGVAESGLYPTLTAPGGLSPIDEAVLAADLHAGSKYAPCPDNWKWRSGATYRPSDLQLALFDKYMEVVEEFKKPKLLLVDGDLVDGSGRIDEGRDLFMTDPFDQADLAIYLIDLWDAETVLITHGSKYHDERGSVTMGTYVAEHIKAPQVRHGWVLKYTINGVRCSFAHEVSVPSGVLVYRPTPAAIQLVINKLNYADQAANLIARAHTHVCAYGFFSDQLTMLLPAWQGETPYTARKAPESRSSIGIVHMDLPSLNFDLKVWPGPSIPPQAAKYKVQGKKQ